MSEGGEDIIIRVRQKCLQRAGGNGIRAIGRQFRIMDDNGNHSLGPEELRTGLQDFGIKMSTDELKQLISVLDTNKDGSVDINEFLKGLRGGLGPRRLAVVQLAFAKFDRDGTGQINLDDLRDVYDAKENPLVKQGKKTEDEVLEDFLKTFDSQSNPDGIVTKEEFESYYAGISASIDKDVYFEHMVRAAWKLDDGACGGGGGGGYRAINAGAPQFGSSSATGPRYINRYNVVPHVYCWMDISIAGGSPGRITFELYAGKAPRTCENFRSLCTGERGKGQCGQPLHYKGLRFHRIVSKFCAQAGDVVRNDGKGQESIYGRRFDDETFAVHHDKAGVLSMANKGPNTNGSQFFILLEPASYLDGKHVAFGKVCSGMDVVASLGRMGSDGGQPKSACEIVDCGQCDGPPDGNRRS